MSGQGTTNGAGGDSAGSRTSGPWFERPDFEAQLAVSDLDEDTEALVERFATDGYLVIDDVGLDDFDATADRIIADVARRDTGDNRVQDAWMFSAAVRDLAVAPRVLELLSALYQRSPFPFQTLNFERGTEQATHSDAVHFHTTPSGFMCGVWVALEDVDAENGPLHYYPGSHRLPVYLPGDFGLERGRASYTAYEERMAEVIEQRQLVKAEVWLRRSQALVWAANLLHGGSAIVDSERTRLSQVTHYYFPGCLYFCPVMSDQERPRLRRPLDIETGALVSQGIPVGDVDSQRDTRVLLNETTTWLAARNRTVGNLVHRVRYR